MSFSDRLNKVLNYYELKAWEFEKKAKISNGIIGKALERNTGFSGSVLRKIKAAFPQLNIEWLHTGHGEMILKPFTDKSTEDKNREFSELEVKHLKLQEEHYQLYQKYISLLEKYTECLERKP